MLTRIKELNVGTQRLLLLLSIITTSVFFGILFKPVEDVVEFVGVLLLAIIFWVIFWVLVRVSLWIIDGYKN